MFMYVVLSQLDFLTTSPQILWVSIVDDWIFLTTFHSMRDLLLSFYYLVLFSYYKIHCVQCRRMTETTHVTTVTSKNKMLMKREQCVTCCSITTHFIKGDATGRSCLNSAINKSLLSYICQAIILLNLVQNLIKDWIQMEHQKNGASQSIELIMQLIMMIYAILRMMILKLGIRGWHC